MQRSRQKTRIWPKPHLSVLIPAYREQQGIGNLVRDLLIQADDALKKHTDYHLEVVIASDDMFDYSSILPVDPRLVFCEPKMATGPSLARSRALDKSRGKLVVAIDADDAVCSDFIDKVYAASKVHQAFAVKTSYLKSTTVVRSLEVKTLNLENFIEYSGSASVVFPREWIAAYPDVVAEDAVAVINTIQRAGGCLPVIDAHYKIATHPESFCARLGSQFSKLYAEHLENIDDIARVTGNPEIVGMLRTLYSERIRVNNEYEFALSTGRDLGYHEFIVSQKASDSELSSRDLVMA